jgi:peptidyl-prolyl cis-trans isomerase A (cyclophilin A)
MRFETSVGSFDMELNPTNDPNLQPLVDNIVAYIGLGRYHHTVINRAPDGFVLQMGSFLGFPPTPENFLGLIQEIERLDAVVVDGNGDGTVDFNAQSNVRGTVSLALSSGPNTGTSSFFINLGDNSGLDGQGFVPFARIVDMAPIDQIMALEKTNLTGNPNDLTFNNVPLLENGRLLILKSVRVLEAAPDFSFVGPVQAALEQIQQAEQQQAAAALLAASAANSSATSGAPLAGVLTPANASASGASAAAAATPEPTGLALTAAGVLAGAGARRRRAS